MNYLPLNLVQDIPVQRIITGISAIDSMLGGGLPLGAISMMAGSAGTGKSRTAINISSFIIFRAKENSCL
jgi:predicted ATP-dependent serine protease